MYCHLLDFLDRIRHRAVDGIMNDDVTSAGLVDSVVNGSCSPAPLDKVTEHRVAFLHDPYSVCVDDGVNAPYEAHDGVAADVNALMYVYGWRRVCTMTAGTYR